MIEKAIMESVSYIYCIQRILCNDIFMQRYLDLTFHLGKLLYHIIDEVNYFNPREPVILTHHGEEVCKATYIRKRDGDANGFLSAKT